MRLVFVAKWGKFCPKHFFFKADLKYVDCVIEFVTKIYCNRIFFVTESTTNCTFQGVNCSFRGAPPTTQLRLFPCCETRLIVLCNWRNNDSMLLLPCTICLPVYEVWVFHNTCIASSQSLLGPYYIILYYTILHVGLVGKNFIQDQVHHPIHNLQNLHVI